MDIKTGEWLNARSSTRILLLESGVPNKKESCMPELLTLFERYHWLCLPVLQENLPDESLWRVLTSHADACVVNNTHNNLSFTYLLLLATLWQKNTPVLIFGNALIEFLDYKRMAFIEQFTDLEVILENYKHSRSISDYRVRIDIAMQGYKV